MSRLRVEHAGESEQTRGEGSVPRKHGRESSHSARKFEKYARLLSAISVSLLAVFVSGCRSRRSAQVATDAVVVIMPREPEQLDPRFVGDAYGLKLTRLLHASLVRVDAFTLEPTPDLAESVTIETPTRYRAHLRAGLSFSDGSALDSADVVATFQGLVDPKVKSRFMSTFARVVSVKADGPRDVLFELDAPHATFITDLEMPILRAEDALVPASPGRLPLGAGAYLLKARETGMLWLAANPHYHAGPVEHPHLKLLVIHDDNTRALRMLAGAGDLALNTIPQLLLPLFKPPEFRIQSEPGVGTTYVGINLEHHALRDPRVRRALAHAIDRERLIAYKLFGRAQLATSWIAASHWAYAEDTPRYDFDPARARALLDEAGLAPRADGFRLALTLRTSSDRGVISIARALSSMLRDVGIDLDVRPSEGATLLADLARGRFELAFLQSPDVVEPHVLSWFFASDRIPEKGKREGANRWRLRDPELDAALEQGRANTERSTRIAAYQRVQHLLARDLPVIPLWHDDVIAVTSARLSGFRVPRDARFGTLALGAPTAATGAAP
jgi:peptide/nickel transport system substrate-binding protein